jgi:branched-chain amino acid transport system permease protein
MSLFVETVLNGIIIGAIYALMALGFVIPYKTMRVANFALGELVLYGAIFSALGYSVLGLFLPLAVLFGAGAMALWLAAFNRLVFARIVRSQTITLLMVTLGYGIFMHGFLTLFPRRIPFSVPLPLPHETLIVWDMYISPNEVLIGIVALLASAAVGALFRWTRFGLALRALAEDPETAAAMGIRADRYCALAWTVTGCIAVVSGVLWTDLRGPGFTFTHVGLKVLPIVIVGGLDSIAGTFLGGMLIGILDNLAATYLDVWLGLSISQIVSFLLLVAFMLLRPQGLLGSKAIERV